MATRPNWLNKSYDVLSNVRSGSRENALSQLAQKTVYQTRSNPTSSYMDKPPNVRVSPLGTTFGAGQAGTPLYGRTPYMNKLYQRGEYTPLFNRRFQKSVINPIDSPAQNWGVSNILGHLDNPDVRGAYMGLERGGDAGSFYDLLQTVPEADLQSAYEKEYQKQLEQLNDGFGLIPSLLKLGLSAGFGSVVGPASYAVSGASNANKFGFG